MNGRRPTALIADDEPLLRDELAGLLALAWPALEVVAFARNGRDALAHFEAHRPDICFLDVHMPGWSGLQVAQRIGRRARLVFVTAFDRYALNAFDAGALDYLVKPVQPARLAETVLRLQERLAPAPDGDTEAIVAQLAARLQPPAALSTPPAPLRWLRASVGTALRLIAVEDVDYLKSDEKYTLVAWRGEGGQPAEALLRLPLRDLHAQLDPAQFVQVHRSVVVNLAAVRQVVRGENETADIHLKHRPEVLPVSRSHLHLFKPI